MSDEVKVTETIEKKECKCFCKSKEFKKFLVVALGTFVGAYCALSLFAALHRPPMMPPQGFHHRNGCPCKMIKQHHHFDKMQIPSKGNFKGHKEAPAPFDANRAEAGR